jgi:diaminopimelate decarboxylase
LESHGVLMDPVLLRRDAVGGRAGGGPVRAFLFGGLCLESDLITRRAVHLPQEPRPGDLMAFANTAGYCMDFHATGAQRLPAARMVAAWREGGTWRWCLDEEYWPTAGPKGRQ